MAVLDTKQSAMKKWSNYAGSIEIQQMQQPDRKFNYEWKEPEKKKMLFPWRIDPGATDNELNRTLTQIGSVNPKSETRISLKFQNHCFSVTITS